MDFELTRGVCNWKQVTCWRLNKNLEESREAFLWSHTGILASILTLTIAFNQNKPFYSVMFSVHSSMLDGIFHPTSFFRHVFIKFL